jgi:hypothetical protein
LETLALPNRKEIKFWRIEAKISVESEKNLIINARQQMQALILRTGDQWLHGGANDIFDYFDC